MVSPFLMVLERAATGRGVPLVVVVFVEDAPAAELPIAPLPVAELLVAELPEAALLEALAELSVDELLIIAELSVAELPVAELSVDELLIIAELSLAPLLAVELSVAELPDAPLLAALSEDELPDAPLDALLSLPELPLIAFEDELRAMGGGGEASLPLLLPLLASSEYASAPSAANASSPKMIGRTDFFSPSSRAIVENAPLQSRAFHDAGEVPTNVGF